MRDRNPLTPFYYKKEGFFDYGFKNVGIYSDPTGFAADERVHNEDYMIIDYCEVIRHGKIIEPHTISKNYFPRL